MGTPYFAFVPAAVTTSPDSDVLIRLAETLSRNPGIDVVGTNMVDPATGAIHLGCRNMQMCHWTLILEYRYYCGDRTLMRCDTTSPFFVSRGRHVDLLDAALVGSGPLLAHFDFFHKLKNLASGAATVVTAIDEQVLVALTASYSWPARPTGSSSHSSSTAAMVFAKRYAVTQIKDLDGDSGIILRVPRTQPGEQRRPASSTLDLCETQASPPRPDDVLDPAVLAGVGPRLTCDGRLHESMMGKHWQHFGTSMPIYFYEYYSLALREASKFLQKHDVRHIFEDGAALGFLKFGRMIPWDRGDVDIAVDVDGFGGCEKWLSLLKAWADEKGFKHPHVDPAGAICEHYGVYAAPRGTYVDDPYSMGLITFTKFPKYQIEPTSLFKTHGTTVRVPRNIGQYVMVEYGRTALQHVFKSSGNVTQTGLDADIAQIRGHCVAPPQFSHNCIARRDSTYADTCMRHTGFATA